MKSPYNRPAYRRGVRLSVTIAPKASWAIDRLLATGLFGRSRAELAQRFIYAGLQEQYVKGWVTDPPKPRAGRR